MQHIVLAYCSETPEWADRLDRALSGTGILFSHLSDRASEPPGTFAAALKRQSGQVLLIVTDNMLKNAACLVDLLPALQELARDNRLRVAVADGFTLAPDGSRTTVVTHFDRMVFVLQHLNHWQNAWLDLSTEAREAANEAEKAAIESRTTRIREIANSIGDILTLLRDVGFIAWDDLSNQQFRGFFRMFGMDESLSAKVNMTQAVPPVADIQPSAPHIANIPVVSGPLTPIPLEPELPQETLPMSGIDQLLAKLDEPEAAQQPPAEEEEDKTYDREDIKLTIRDAWLWLENGRIEQGLETLRTALEQYPDSDTLRREYERAQQQYGTATNITPPAYEAPTTPETPPVQPEIPASKPEPVQPPAPEQMNEIRSYDMMGDMALDKGDFLFAKYCWDRVVELSPEHPGVYRKLALVTYDHLHDYKETASQYLQKALAQHLNDAELLVRMAEVCDADGDPDAAADYYRRALQLDPSLQRPVLDRLLIAPEPEIPETPEPVPDQQPPAEAPAPSIPAARNLAPLTVLITGATSGIGRATADLFARHGHRVILTGRRIERLTAMKNQFDDTYRNDTLIMPLDVREQATVEQAIEHLPESWRNIDVLVNNAGLAKGLAPIHEGNLEHWETMIDTNIKGLLYMTRAIAPGMVARQKGHIINVGSSAGKEVYPNGNVYCATKFAVDALTRAMRMDLYTHKVRVSQVSPGHVEETEFALNRFDGDAERARIYEDFQPLKAEDVAEAIYWMATRPAHVNIQDIFMFSTQQAASTMVDRSGR